VRTFSRIATTTVALAAVFPFGMTAASADTVGEPASASAYFSSTTPVKDDAYPADPGPYFNQLGTDRVGPGNLAVAVTVPDKTDKESFLRFDLLSVPQGATITSAVVTVPLQPDDKDNQSANAAPAKVRACAAGPEGFADGVDAGGYDEKPKSDCDKLNSAGKASADGKAYTFDVTALATSWMTEINDGIALVPAVLDQPFQVVFQPGAKATIAVAYTAGAATITEPPLPSAPVLPPVYEPAPVAPPVVDTGSVAGPPVVAAAPQPTPAPTPAPRPKVAAGARPIATVASGGGFTEHNGLSAGFWLAALVGVGLIGAISLVLGSPEVPVRASGVQNGVGRALDDRRRRAAHRSGVRPTTRPIATT
jgi:hypothetical protein